MIKKILLMVVFVFLSTSAFGEYYEYTDESGNVRFTDDLYQVPESQRPAMKTFESEKTVPDETAVEASAGNETKGVAETSEIEETDAPPETGDQPVSSEPVATGTVEEAVEGSFQMSAVELNKMQSELNETRTALETERAAIEAATPKEGATSNERIAHSMQVDALNAKIVQYDNDLKVFEEKVAAFNNKKKKISE